jgi:hypothetical protein
LEHKTHQGEIHLLLLDCILHSPFFPKSLCSSDLKLCFGKENSLSTFGFIMAWIRSKLAMTSGFLNGFNSGLFLRNQKIQVMFLETYLILTFPFLRSVLPLF